MHIRIDCGIVAFMVSIPRVASLRAKKSELASCGVKTRVFSSRETTFSKIPARACMSVYGDSEWL